MSSYSVADALCRLLAGQGVDVAFGHPGGAILPFYDALHRAPAPRHVLVRHEQAAAHAADGYARATGRAGVCIATSGPGATNLVTGLATALMDGVPIVAITGQVPTAVRGTDAFQETDVLGLTMPVTKHGFMVERAEDLEAIVRDAFRIALGGRPGPVVIDIPKDVLAAAWPGALPETPASGAGGNGPALRAPTRFRTAGEGEGTAGARRAGSETGERRERSGRGGDRFNGVGGLAAQSSKLGTPIEVAARLVNGAARPLILAGRGVVSSDTAPLLRALAERAGLPVVTTLLGLDGFPATHPLALGMPGMHGTVRACQAIQRADVMLGLGVRFDDRVTGKKGTFAPQATIIHAEIDPGCFGRTVQADVMLPGDLRDTLPSLLSRIAAARHPEWWDELEQWPREAAPAEPAPDPYMPLTGRAACRGLAARIAAAGAIAVSDVGQHQMWLAQELRDAEPGTHLTSGGLGAMGYALPAGLGAACGRPDRAVWVVAGDGGFQMTLQELATVVQERLPLRIAILNNGFLGMVRQWQEMFYDRRYSASELTGPDLPVLARAYGIPARAVELNGDLDAALDWADGADGPVLLDLRVDREENVFPMVPPGAALHEVVASPVGARA